MQKRKDYRDLYKSLNRLGQNLRQIKERRFRNLILNKSILIEDCSRMTAFAYI